MKTLLHTPATWLVPLRRAVDERLTPPFLWLVGGAMLAVGLMLLAMSFATSDHGRTLFGPPLGADFAGFYAAAQVLDGGQPELLYDRATHDRLYHTLLPNLAADQSIPYVHPPFIAAALRPITWLPYETAFALWLVVSAALYLAGLALVRRTVPALAPDDWRLVLLLAVTFEPFLLECWMGGQLSALGFLGFALALFAHHRGRPFAAGMALGLCLYKPPFLVLVLPLLLVSRQWRVLLGVAATGLLLAALAVAAVGLDVCLGYADVLLAFRKSTTGADGLALRTWKYIDLNSSLRLLLGGPSPAQTGLVLVLAVAPLGMLVRAWLKWDATDEEGRGLLWATALTWTPVLNLYVGVYDSVLVVQSALLTAGFLCSQHGWHAFATPSPVGGAPLGWRGRDSMPPPRNLCASGLAYVLLLVAMSAWFSQGLARATGVQVYTLALAVLGLYQLWLVKQAEPEAEATGGSPSLTLQARTGRSTVRAGSVSDGESQGGQWSG